MKRLRNKAYVIYIVVILCLSGSSNALGTENQANKFGGMKRFHELEELSKSDPRLKSYFSSLRGVIRDYWNPVQAIQKIERKNEHIKETVLRTVVGFAINSKGKIIKPVIILASPYPTVDRQAIKAIKKVASMAPPEKRWLDINGNFNLVLPIVLYFELSEDMKINCKYGLDNERP